MTELSLVGATELVIARRLDLKAFTSLRCLTLGYITPAESPSDFVSIPDSLQTLIVRWSNRRPKPTYSKTGYFFRSIEAMCNHLRNSEEMSISKRQEALLFVEMFDLSSLEAILLCQERDARLVYVELDQERGPVLLESFKDDQPLHSTLSLAFLPFKWAIVLVS
ncbi:hypothetical protein PUNSTDRAFT_44025 [Punctularia strigosozonata HHB-11173 SS5]|uniref:uncharacterized protein n=1 Tax=Punctularia strigosozonata (strain HHB-11173) TaxID=741275 RepID=UPI000441698C|nr:uncharacterized protein PUNSTDRAFT_44025 [Punctularia strigosozonata HHB-11173 SS5]EIN09732.1 hypothetical protein PUNSTDRAFT_44025 [Punctularia strigosozonata HHB-11173 SS5]